MTVLQYFGYFLGAIGLAGTLLPLVRSGKPVFRIWDFPRAQLAAALVAAVSIEALAFSILTTAEGVYSGMLVGALVWQTSRIVPYTPYFRRQAHDADGCTEGRGLRLMASNVLMDNRDTARLLARVSEVRPDVLLLVETDATWDAALKDLDADFPYNVRHPQDNFYGMHLFSKFELVDPRVRFLIDDEIPSIKTAVRLPSGELIQLYAVHPQPPPMVDAEERDAELLLVAKEIAAAGEPAIVAGDLNDVAWSRSTHRFQKVSGLIDPRVGRGLYSTFDARRSRYLRWPLDHVFFSPSFRLMDVRVLGNVGSDHLPFFVSLCYAPEEPGQRPPPRADKEEVREADQTIKEGMRKADS